MSNAVAEARSAAEWKWSEWVKPGLLALALAGVWAEFVGKLTTDWSTNQQYEFGPFVPFFILVLLVLRWGDRPVPETYPSRILVLVSAGVLFLTLLPIRIVQEANPDWRPLNWVHAAAVIGLSMTALAGIGGRSWLRHFSVPLWLILFALPWPLATEQGVVQFLTRHVTAGTAEVLNVCGIPAFPRGNVIVLADGVVGVNQACSGIRSLAATLMSAAFFGEFYRLKWMRRGALIVLGVFVAFFLNLIRASVLGFLQAAYGTAMFQRWHDKTGLAIFAVSFGILWGMASLFARGANPSISRPHSRGLLDCRSGFERVPLWSLIVGLAWLAISSFATEHWYQLRENSLSPVQDWTIRWPAESDDFHFTPVADEVKSILRFSEAATGTIRASGRPTWQVYFVKWDAGRTSAQLAVMHRPEICLPSTGMRQLGDSGIVTVHAAGLTMPFQWSVFDDEGRHLYVYRCLWEDRAANGASPVNGFDIGVKGRLKAAWAGRRNLGQRLLQVGIFDAKDEAAAREDLLRHLPDLITKS